MVLYCTDSYQQLWMNSRVKKGGRREVNRKENMSKMLLRTHGGPRRVKIRFGKAAAAAGPGCQGSARGERWALLTGWI